MNKSQHLVFGLYELCFVGTKQTQIEQTQIESVCVSESVECLQLLYCEYIMQLEMDKKFFLKI